MHPLSKSKSFNPHITFAYYHNRHTNTLDDADADVPNDRMQLIVHLCASSLELSFFSIREGLAYTFFARLLDPAFDGDEIDVTKCIRFLVHEFTKCRHNNIRDNTAENPEVGDGQCASPMSRVPLMVDVC
jgi:hypothetical protein